VAIAQMLSKLDCWTTVEQDALRSFTHSNMSNWRKLEVGATRANF